MRIRTIKPEFWISESIAQLSDFAKLLAIGLLNYADDAGYFWANPILIRAAIFPFQNDVSKIEKAVSELSKVGFITLAKAPDGRLAGKVVNFTFHQRIDRPKDSIISQIVKFDDQSTIDPRSIDDRSLLEGKGKEGKGSGNRDACGDRSEQKSDQPSEKKGSTIEGSTVLPDSLAADPRFVAAWCMWLGHLRQKRKPATLHAQDLQLQRCVQWGVERALKAIEVSIERNWQSIYEETNHGNSNGRNSFIAGGDTGKARRILDQRQAQAKAGDQTARGTVGEKVVGA